MSTSTYLILLPEGEKEEVECSSFSEAVKIMNEKHGIGIVEVA